MDIQVPKKVCVDRQNEYDHSHKRPVGQDVEFQSEENIYREANGPRQDTADHKEC